MCLLGYNHRKKVLAASKPLVIFVIPPKFGLGHGVLISGRQCDNSNYIMASVVSNNYILELLT